MRRSWLAGRARRALRLAWYWHAAGDLDGAARAAGNALRLARRHHPVPAALVAEAALTLARIARDRDDLDGCRTHLEDGVTVLRAAPGGAEHDPLLGWALVGLGDLNRRAGRYPAARTVLASALALVESLQPPDPALRAAVLTAQGITAKESGAFAVAAECYSGVAAIHREAGASRADAATLEHNLAGLAYARGHRAEAEAHARRALVLRRQVPRLTEVELAADLAVLASALAAQRRYDEARVPLLRALAAYRHARPPRRYEIAVQLHNLADIEHAAGHRAVAEDLYRQALSVKEALLGTEHPEVGLVANNLGTLLAELGREPEAASCYRRALTIAERAHGPDHPVIDRIRHNLARLDPGARPVGTSPFSARTTATAAPG